MSKVFNMVGGGGGPYASIFVTGLSETDTVTATNGSKTLTGKWTSINKVVNENIIPVMTSNTTPEGIVSCSQNESDGQPYQAFDGNVDSAWFFQKTVGAWIQYEFAEKHDFNEVIITSCPSHSNRCVTSSVTLSTENETIGTFTLNAGFSTSTTITFGTVNAKRLRVTVNGFYSSREYSGFSTIQINGPVRYETPAFLIKPIRELGTWTVTATDGSNTATQDVLVDVITNYEIEMSLSA